MTKQSDRIVHLEAQDRPFMAYPRVRREQKPRRRDWTWLFATLSFALFLYVMVGTLDFWSM